MGPLTRRYLHITESTCSYTVLEAVPLFRRIATDCLNNVNSLAKGGKAATAANQAYARVWSFISALSDDDDASFLAERFAWMPR